MIDFLVLMIDFLKSIPSGFWIALLTLGASLGGVIITNNGNNKRIKLQHDLESKRKDDLLLLNKGEELLFLLGEYRSKNHDRMGDCVQLFDKLKRQPVTLEEATLVQLSGDFTTGNKALAVSRLYFPALDDAAKSMNTAATVFNKAIDEFCSACVRAQKENSIFRGSRDKLEKASDELTLKVDAFLNAVIKELHKTRYF